MDITYTNEYGGLLTKQQTEKARSYKKEIRSNGELKLIEYYVKQKLRNGSYFLDNSESIQEIIDRYANTALSWVFYYNKQTNMVGDNTYEYKVYYDGILKEKGACANDSQGRLIAKKITDLSTNAVNSKRKFFYSDSQDFQSYEDYTGYAISFDYLDHVTEVYCVFHPHVEETYSLDDFLAQEDIMEIFPWEEHTYYHSFDPILPPDPIV